MTVIRLYHGTDMASALNILQNGLDAALAAGYNGGGEFWATAEFSVAEWFAKSNPAGSPAIFIFELLEALLQSLVNSPSKTVFAHSTAGGIDYEFLPASFAEINKEMANKKVFTLP